MNVVKYQLNIWGKTIISQMGLADKKKKRRWILGLDKPMESTECTNTKVKMRSIWPVIK